jgi:hypothetical protein
LRIFAVNALFSRFTPSVVSLPSPTLKRILGAFTGILRAFEKNQKFFNFFEKSA